jgi:hypothetical protein
MAFIADEVFDSGLDNLTGLSPTARIDINYGSEATDYNEATNTKSCGNETGITIPAAAAGAVDGRRVIVPAITAGDVTDDQTAGWWALTDGAAVLWATGPLTATQAVTSGNTFTLDAISITIRDATAV